MDKKKAKIILLGLFFAIVAAFGLGLLLDVNAFSYAGVLLTVALVITYAIVWR